MISYYYNPKTQDLIIYYPEEKEIFIIEKIKSIRVETGGEIKMGDDGEREDNLLMRRNGNLRLTKFKFKKLSVLKTKSGRTKITSEVISEMKRMRSELKSGREIAEALGISEGAVWKYLKKNVEA